MTERSARLLVFGTSASVLVIEILAGRLMAPYVGVTIEAFTGIIGTVLAAIAIGSWWGGKAADRGDPVRLLGPLLIAGGLLTLAAPILVTFFGPSLRGSAPLQIVVLTVLAFLAPALVLSAVSPVVVKLRLTSLDETGTVVGSLSAIGTAGALFGTFVTGFVLIASFPTRPIIIGLGAALVGIGVVLQSRRRLEGGSIGAAVLAVVVLAAGVVVFDGPCNVETTYSCAIVEPDPARDNGRTLWLDNARHSYVDVVDPTHLQFRYTQLMGRLIATLETGSDPHILSIGGGGFTLPRWIQSTMPDATQTVLEVDARLVELAYAELGLAPGDVDTIMIGDARHTVSDVVDEVDLVLADAFGGFVVPWHLTTAEFLTDVRDSMASDGIFMMNLIDYPPSAFARSEVATIASVFDHVVVFAPDDYFEGIRGGNFVIVASQQPLDEQALSAAAAGDEGTERPRTGTDLAAWIDEAAVLTDDFAPVDQLITR